MWFTEELNGIFNPWKISITSEYNVLYRFINNLSWKLDYKSNTNIDIIQFVVTNDLRKTLFKSFFVPM